MTRPDAERPDDQRLDLRSDGRDVPAPGEQPADPLGAPAFLPVEDADANGSGKLDDSAPLASERDRSGLPVHRGWAPMGGRRRWMEPFVLVLLAEGPAHGYAIVGQLEEMGVSAGELDFGTAYRTLRELEAAGLVTSTWSTEAAGPQRRDYALTDKGYVALDEWDAVMRERARLIAEFEARYLAAVAVRRRSGHVVT